MSASLYTTDFYAWAQHQSDYLRLEEFDKIDWQNIAEELQDLGNQTRREVESRLRLIIMHLLKWQWQPDHQSRSWRNTINVQRRNLMRLLKKNPTLRAQLSDFVPDTYAEACEDAFEEMGLLHWTFPADCPYTAEQLVDTDFRAVRVTRHIDQQIAQQPVHQPWRRVLPARTTARGMDLRQRNLELIERVVPRLVDPRRLARWPDEHAGEQVGQRRPLLPQ